MRKGVAGKKERFVKERGSGEGRKERVVKRGLKDSEREG